MKRQNLFNFLLCFSFFLFFITPVNLWGAVFLNFDDFPVTGTNDLPSDAVNWLYTTSTINPDNAYTMTTDDWAGWRGTKAFPARNIYSFFHLYVNGANSSHMGFETYGFLEIDGEMAVRGKSLKYYITGGKNESTLPNASGLRVTKKAHYLSYLGNGQDPVGSGSKVGHPYIYFKNTSPSTNPTPFPESQNKNRLSMYVYAPDSLTIGNGGGGNPTKDTIHVGPYNGIGGHWYNIFATNGGGWVHLLVDGHPQHNNAWGGDSTYPYPSRSLRDMGYDYFNNMYRFYLTFLPYSGIGVPPYSICVDEIEFLDDKEPQNNETICSVALLYLSDTKKFEIAFKDKYKNNGYNHSTYEVRYSFSQITNANWESAKPVHIIADSRFGINARTDGKFQKWWPYYQNVWAPFKLAPSDEVNLLPGTTVYFAVKDVSQVGGNSKIPVAPISSRWSTGGRDYQNRGGSFDYAGDQPVLNLIKRIDYYISGEPIVEKPLAPSNLRFILGDD